MLGRCLSLIILWSLSLSAYAIPSADVITNLKERMHPTTSGGYLIRSFTNSSQSYIYDQALAIIAFSHHGDDKSAKKLLRGLNNLQKEDGSLYFSYYLDGKSPYPEEGDKRFAGAVAWVALAATTYQKIFKSAEFLNFNTLILKYLASQMRSVEIKGQKVSAISFNPTDIPQTDWNESDVAALEHNLDAYSAFLHFSRLNSDKNTEAISTDLKKYILAMWDESQSHFWSGTNLKTGVVNKDEFYLDNQSWSLLALDEKTIKGLNAKNALTMNCDGLLVEHEAFIGFMDSKPARRPANLKFVWSEGTAGQILAMRKYNKIQNESIICKGQDFNTLLENIIKMKKKDGGIAYSTSTTNPDFTTASSVAGTAWYYFAANNINPFQLD